MKTLDLDSIEEQARETILAAFDPATVFFHDVDRALMQSAISEGRGAPETLALVGVIRDLQRALAAVLPYAESRAEDMDEAASEEERFATNVRGLSAPPQPLEELERAARDARELADRTCAAVEDAKAELDSLVQKTRPLADLRVMKTPNGTWSVRHETLDEKGRRLVHFLGEWALESTARVARRSALRGLPVPPPDVPGGPPPAMLDGEG